MPAAHELQVRWPLDLSDNILKMQIDYKEHHFSE